MLCCASLSVYLVRLSPLSDVLCCRSSHSALVWPVIHFARSVFLHIHRITCVSFEQHGVPYHLHHASTIIPSISLHMLSLSTSFSSISVSLVKAAVLPGSHFHQSISNTYNIRRLRIAINSLGPPPSVRSSAVRMRTVCSSGSAQAVVPIYISGGFKIMHLECFSFRSASTPISIPSAPACLASGRSETVGSQHRLAYGG